MLGEADLKDIFFVCFFAEPIKTPSQQNTVKRNTHFVDSDFLPQSCDIKIIQ